MDIIITKRSSRETIDNVLYEMEEPLEPLRYSLRRGRFVDNVFAPIDVGIRWGCTASLDNEIPIEYNTAGGIELASNKKKCREFLNNRGIAVPEPVNLRSITGSQRDNDLFPIVVRPSFHQKGKDFLLINNLRELVSRRGEIARLSNPYASRFFPKTSEYRVHIGHGKVLSVQKKVQTSCTVGENWNHSNGYVFETVSWKDYRRTIVRLAVDTIEAMGLDFGAVDILADPEDSSLPNAVVCEVNTAPKLEGYTAQRYAEYFDWLVREQEERHFDVPEGSRARHYVFKHRELRDCDYDFNFKGEVNEED